MILLKGTNLTKYFGGIGAIIDVSFEINHGEIVGLIGPNGAGKTTLFNLVSGFLSKDRGQLMFKDKDITHIKPHQANQLGICRIFQLSASFPTLTVAENVKIGAVNHSKGVDIDKKTRELIELVGLQGLEDLLPAQLSYGDLRCMDIARALATSPELLLLDEPFSGLSISEIRSVAQVIQAARSRGLTLIVIEHVLRELMVLVDRVIVLNFGMKIAEGSPDSIAKNEEVIEAYLGKEEIFAVSDKRSIS